MFRFDLIKLFYLKIMYWKHSNPRCNGNRRDQVALKTNSIKILKFRIIKIRTGCQYVGYIYYNGNLNWAVCNPRVGRSWSRPSPRFL